MSAAALPSTDEVWRWLADVPDPEIPVVSLTDLGIIRSVAHEGDTLVVILTPTYSGCPATSIITLDVETALRERGVEKLRVERRLSPAWTTDWITAEAREKLRDYGIAPPIDGTAADGQRKAQALLSGSNMAVACPRCGSHDTEKISQFGSTPCKAHYRCKACLEPFDYFKCI
jgi:ring-1,2-phenylacetyl-CoA epoxidase subunit PaaD